ncbi:MAG: flagellar hook capping FlgD N-terminal domain-containing protein [Planctomycetota bacterium]
MSSISGFSTTQPTSSSGNDVFSELTTSDFLEIMFTELQNQDPFEPSDTQAMIDQLSSLRAIEADTQFADQLEELVDQNELAAASGLIGSLVSGVSLDNRRVADLVISVTQTDQGPVLNLFDGSQMFFSNIDEILGPLNDDSPDDQDEPDDQDDTDPPSVGDAGGLIGKFDDNVADGPGADNTDSGTGEVGPDRYNVIQTPAG